jgi:cob(I)alamin adenosyltransferase
VILGAGQVELLWWSIPKRGATMPRVDPETLRKVEQAILRYTHEVEQSNLAADTKWTSLRHARTLVRWLADDFESGERAR